MATANATFGSLLGGGGSSGGSSGPKIVKIINVDGGGGGGHGHGGGGHGGGHGGGAPTINLIVPGIKHTNIQLAKIAQLSSQLNSIDF